jgi:hypothetical protein
MSEPSTVLAFLASIKSATELAKAIRDASASFQQAEVTETFRMESLAEARMQAAGIQEVIKEKDERIAELEKAFQLKSTLVRDKDVYYESDPQGPVGDPYCTRCWEVEHKAISVSAIIDCRSGARPAT